MYQGFFINLDSNEVRRRSLAAHLEKRGVGSRYQRVQAVDGRAVAEKYPSKLQPGSLGCWLSHLKTLQSCSGAKQHLHIIEDDTVFAQDAASTFATVLEFVDEKFGGWDLVFTDIHVIPADVQSCRLLSKLMKKHEQTGQVFLADLQNVAFAATSSYFVNWRSIEKYTRLLSDPGKAEVPIDLYLRGLVNQKVLQAYVTVPFLTSVSVDSSQSDICGELDRSRSLSNLFRRAFFKDADLPSLDAEMQEFVQDIALSPLEMFHLKALLFTLSDQYQDF